MLPRERIQAALAYRAPDVLPVRIYPGDGGLFEHGRPLARLVETCGHDFGDLGRVDLPDPPRPDDFDADGQYHAYRLDEWGTNWEYRIFGVWGHPCAWPLDDLADLGDYLPPPAPVAEGPDVDAERDRAAEHRARHYLLGPGGSLFEKMHALRRFEDVLMDVALDTPQINRIADMIMDHVRAQVARSLAVGADGIAFGDDFGTQSAMIMAPETWRRFFRPRYDELFAPIRAAGRDIFFHCCGRVGPILPDLRDLGVSAIWPQLTAYDLPELARICRDLGLAVELHPDRGDLMQSAPPDAVRAYLERLFELFDTPGGGSWLYIEIDPGFAFANVEALFETAMRLRAG